MEHIKIPAWLVSIVVIVFMLVVLERLYYSKVPVDLWGLKLDQPGVETVVNSQQLQSLSGNIGFSKSGSHKLKVNGSLWDNEGENKTITECIPFRPAFKTKPNVTVGINLMDIDQKENTRIKVDVTKVTENEFCIDASTWNGTKIWAFRVGWIAIGEKA